MPATTVPYLHITDGTTDINLLDGTNYGLPRGMWAPRVAVRKRSTLGGRPYTTVVEEIPINVRGSTAAAAMANLAAISHLLDQAQNWYDDETADPVLIKYQPHGSLLTSPLQTLIYAGAAEGGELIQLPGGFNDVGMIFEISGVVLRFVRDGAWYGPPEDVSAPEVPEPIDHPTVLEGTFATDVQHYSPVDVDLSPLPERDSLEVYDAGFLLIAPAAEYLQVLDASTMSGGVFTSDADAGRHPEGAGVLIYTPAGTTEVGTALGAVTLTPGKRVGVVAALRNSSASTTFTVRVEIAGPSGRNTASTPPYIVDPGSTDPRIVFLGVALCDEVIYTGLQLWVTASAAADTLVVDYFALIVMDDPASRILAIGPTDLTQFTTIGETTELRVETQVFTSRSPRIHHVSDDFPDTFYALPEYWKGDAFLLSKGMDIAAVYCGRNSVGGYWKAWDTDLNESISGAFTFHRYPVYLVPE
jgi:hypothetical protein